VGSFLKRGKVLKVSSLRKRGLSLSLPLKKRGIEGYLRL